jgi:hypothetical protein
MVLALCRRDQCPLLAPLAEDATTILIRSWDGGVTWSEMGRVEGAALTVGLVRGQLPLYRTPAPALVRSRRAARSTRCTRAVRR